MRIRNTLVLVFAVVLGPMLALSAGTGSLATSSMLGMVAQQNIDPYDTAQQRQPVERDRQPMGEQSDKKSAQMQNHVLAGDLMGVDVYNQEGEELGTVQDVVFDERHQQVSYVVLTRGGFLGIGEDKHAIPWSMVTPRLSEDRLIIPLSKDVLDDQEGFGDQWPRSESELVFSGVGQRQGGMMDNQRRTDQPRENWDERQGRTENDDWQMNEGDPSERAEQQFKMRRASELIGLKVHLQGQAVGEQYGLTDDRIDMRDRDGAYDARGDADAELETDETGIDAEADVDVRFEDEDPAGEISDLLIGTNQGRLEFAVIQPNTDFFENMEDDQIIALPWQSLNVRPQQEAIVADLSRQEVQQLTLAEDDITQLDNQSFRDRFYTMAGISPDQYTRSNGQMAQRNGQMRDSEYRNGQTKMNGKDKHQMGQLSADMQKWSSFAQQCLGPNQQNVTHEIHGKVQEVDMLETDENADAPSGMQYTIEVEQAQRAQMNGQQRQQQNGQQREQDQQAPKQGDELKVYLGPDNEAASALRGQISKDDQVILKGTQCEIDGEQVFVATSIQKNGQTFELHQKNGAPKWESKSQGHQMNGQKMNGQQKQHMDDQKMNGKQQHQMDGQKMNGKQQQGQMGQPRQQMGQSQELQKWSSFATQCLGPNHQRADQSVRGTVRNVGTMYTSENADAPDGLRFIINSQDNERVTVYAGPRNSVASALDIYRGDQVTVEGTRCDIENEQVFVATSIQTNGTTYTLTEKDGVPQWQSRDQKQQKQGQQQDRPRGR